MIAKDKLPCIVEDNATVYQAEHVLELCGECNKKTKKQCVWRLKNLKDPLKGTVYE